MLGRARRARGCRRPGRAARSRPACLRCSQIAWATARMWASLKLRRRAEPRWPEVPKATRWAGSRGSGCSGRVAPRRRSGTSTRTVAGGGLAGEGVGHVLECGTVPALRQLRQGLSRPLPGRKMAACSSPRWSPPCSPRARGSPTRLADPRARARAGHVRGPAGRGRRRQDRGGAHRPGHLRAPAPQLLRPRTGRSAVGPGLGRQVGRLRGDQREHVPGGLPHRGLAHADPGPRQPAPRVEGSRRAGVRSPRREAAGGSGWSIATATTSSPPSVPTEP